MSKDKYGKELTDQIAEAMISDNLRGYDLMFRSSEVIKHCANADCNYPLTEENTHYTSEFGDVCTLCCDMLEGIRFSKASSWFAEAHRLWKQDREEKPKGGTATEDRK